MIYDLQKRTFLPKNDYEFGSIVRVKPPDLTFF